MNSIYNPAAARNFSLGLKADQLYPIRKDTSGSDNNLKEKTKTEKG